eukprot:1157398-Pelagomonas_calceolata.AAC.7
MPASDLVLVRIHDACIFSPCIYDGKWVPENQCTKKRNDAGTHFDQASDHCRLRSHLISFKGMDTITKTTKSTNDASFMPSHLTPGRPCTAQPRPGALDCCLGPRLLAARSSIVDRVEQGETHKLIDTAILDMSYSCSQASQRAALCNIHKKNGGLHHNCTTEAM